MGTLVRDDLFPSLDNRFTAHTKPIADGHLGWIEQLGTTYDLHIFWEDLIFTFEPEHVKVCRKSSHYGSIIILLPNKK
jgi:hypothetical protein